LPIRTVRKFTSWHQTSNAVERELPPTLRLLQVKCYETMPSSGGFPHSHFFPWIIFKRFLLLFTSDMVSSQLQLHRYATGRESRVVTALTLLKSHLFKWAPPLLVFILMNTHNYNLLSFDHQNSDHHHLLMSLCFRYQGHVSAALVLGGVDCTGPHLHTVSNWV
jgi:hypothetical protein